MIICKNNVGVIYYHYPNYHIALTDKNLLEQVERDPVVAEGLSSSKVNFFAGFCNELKTRCVFAREHFGVLKMLKAATKSGCREVMRGSKGREMC